MAAGDGRHVRSAYEDLGATQTGNIDVPSTPIAQAESMNTLDESILETIRRDVKAVGVKFLHVVYPRDEDILLKDWDLWGPLLLCTFMALMLRGPSTKLDENDGGPELAQVFVVVWGGSVLVTLNTKLLGGNISFLQNLCVLGYCLFPTFIALVLSRILLIFKYHPLIFLLRLSITFGGFGVATNAAMVILGRNHPEQRKVLVLYPIFLFYFVISWLIISRTS